TVGLAVLPILTKLFGILADAAAVVIPIIAKGLEVLVTVFSRLVDAIHPTIEGLSSGFATLGEVVDVFTGKNAAAGGQMRSLIGDAAVPLMGAVAQLRDSWTELSRKVQGAVEGIMGYVRP